MKYLNRISDNELERKLDSAGALLIRGAKACGKTESANPEEDVNLNKIFGKRLSSLGF